MTENQKGRLGRLLVPERTSVAREQEPPLDPAQRVGLQDLAQQLQNLPRPKETPAHVKIQGLGSHSYPPAAKLGERNKKEKEEGPPDLELLVVEGLRVEPLLGAGRAPRGPGGGRGRDKPPGLGRVLGLPAGGLSLRLFLG